MGVVLILTSSGFVAMLWTVLVCQEIYQDGLGFGTFFNLFLSLTFSALWLKTFSDALELGLL